VVIAAIAAQARFDRAKALNRRFIIFTLYSIL
jgi:hypothetical protein